MKTREEVLKFGLSFKNVYEERPFKDQNWQLVRVKESKKAFLWIYEKDGYINLNVKVNLEWRDFWRSAYDAVIAGYHQNKEHWNTIILDGTIPDKDIKRMIAESYDIITDSPTKRIYEAVKKIPKGHVATYEKVAGMAQYAREEINEIGGYYAYGMDLINGTSVFDFDVTKLSIYTLGNGLAGIEVYDLLRDEYDIQIEFGDICNILAYISIGDRLQDIERLVGALADIERLYKKDSTGMLSGEYIAPAVVASPQQAFYAEKESLPMEQAAGRISGEFVMCYPPGIPILAPGEMITDEIIQYILYVKEKGCSMQGTEDKSVNKLKVLV